MYMALAPSTLLFFYSIIAGAFLGVVYDVFRIIRIACPPKKIGIIVQDITFALICIIVTLMFLQFFTNGALRFFILVGEFVGFLLYYLTIGVIVTKTARVIINIVKKIIYILIWPFRKIFGWIFSKLCPLLSRLIQKLRKILKTSKKRLLFYLRILYNNENWRTFSSKKNKKAKRGILNARGKKEKKKNGSVF